MWQNKLGAPIFPFYFLAPLGLNKMRWEPLVRPHVKVSDVLAGPLPDIWGPSQSYLMTVLWHVRGDDVDHCSAERWAGADFHPGCLCTLLHSSSPLSWFVPQFLQQKNISTAWCRYRHASVWLVLVICRVGHNGLIIKSLHLLKQIWFPFFFYQCFLKKEIASDKNYWFKSSPPDYFDRLHFLFTEVCLQHLAENM